MEFDLIARIRARAVGRDDVVLGIGDDAALVAPPAGLQVAIAMDTLNVGVHFPPGTQACDIGWKALAVNLSDLAAMGATPAWCTLSLSLPDADVAWVDAFLDGFLELATQHDVALIGGDTTRGPLSVCVTAHGFVAPGHALRRDGAQVGDDVWVSGTLGDAAAGLARALSAEPNRPSGPAAMAPSSAVDVLRARLDRPLPRVGLGHALRGLATACIDVSDGLLADAGHLARASGVAMTIDVDALPATDAFNAHVESRQHRRLLQATGGDDYELCFTAPAARRGELEGIALASGVALARIGVVTDGAGVQAHDASGARWEPQRGGFDHFG